MPCAAISDDLLIASVILHRCHLFVTGEQFLALHAFYGDLYEALDGWYDRFAERALAEGETFKGVKFEAIIPTGDCLDTARYQLNRVKEMAENLYTKEDATTKAMIDELIEFLDKMLWQINAMIPEEKE